MKSTSSQSIDVIVGQCKRFELEQVETDKVKLTYTTIQNEYLDQHVHSKTTAEDAIMHLRESEKQAYKGAAKTICSIVDGIQHQSPGTTYKQPQPPQQL